MNRYEYRNGGALQSARRGNALPQARLTPELVREIRANRQGMTAKQWAAKLGVHIRTIDKVRDYKSWIHV